MKNSLLSLLLLSSVAATYAGDLTLVQISNGHGQTTAVYRAETVKTTVALYKGETRKASTSAASDAKLTSRDNAHGASILMVR